MKDMMNTKMTLLGLTAVGWLAVPAVHADVTAPIAFEAVEGNAASEGPFEAFGRRFQQVYDAMGFMDGPVTISAISFRADESVDAPIDTTRGSDAFPLVFKLSTTSASAGTLSSLFDDNVGGDATTVFSGPVSLSTGTVGGSPNAFDVTITFDTPFSYDPSAGNLLLDIAKSSSDIFADALLLDAEDSADDGIASLSGLSPDAAQGIGSSLGLVTDFTVGGVQVIPTPSAVLMGLGLLGLGLTRRRRCA